MNKIWIFLGIVALAFVMLCASGAVMARNWVMGTAADSSMPMSVGDDATLTPIPFPTATATATATVASIATATAVPTAVSAKPVAKPAAKQPVVAKATAVPVVVATAVPVPTQPPQVEVDLKSLDLTAIINALSAKGMKIDSRQIFGDSWVTQSESGPVKGTLPSGYNVLVLSSDSASFSNNEVSFNSSPEGFLAVIVTNSPEFTVDNISYNPENQHRNVSGYALKINATGADLQNFALNLAAFEWSKEHKPYLFFAANGKVVKAAANVTKNINSEQELRSFIAGLLQ